MSADLIRALRWHFEVPAAEAIPVSDRPHTAKDMP